MFASFILELGFSVVLCCILQLSTFFSLFCFTVGVPCFQTRCFVQRGQTTSFFRSCGSPFLHWPILGLSTFFASFVFRLGFRVFSRTVPYSVVKRPLLFTSELWFSAPIMGVFTSLRIPPLGCLLFIYIFLFPCQATSLLQLQPSIHVYSFYVSVLFTPTGKFIRWRNVDVYTDSTS